MDTKELIIFEAARLCYELDISQQEVAKTLGISPATLTRLLQRAKDLGIINITVKPPYEYFKGLDELSQSVKRRLGMREVILVPASSQISVTRKELGYAAAKWISSILTKGARIGFSGGRTIAEIMPFLKKSSEDTQVFQLMGGVSPTEKTIQADVIARNAADRLDGTCHVIHGPAIFPDEYSLTQFLKNKIVADVIEHFDSLDVSVVGIGTLTAVWVISAGIFLVMRERSVKKVFHNVFLVYGSNSSFGFQWYARLVQGLKRCRRYMQHAERRYRKPSSPIFLLRKRL